MKAFAYYRLPYLHHATFVAQHVGEPEVLSSVAELNGKEGFVIAPFSSSTDCPVLLIHPDESKLIPVRSDEDILPSKEDSSRSVQSAYAQDFACFHEHLEKGMCRKLVLARKARWEGRLRIRRLPMDPLRTEGQGNGRDSETLQILENLFQKACRMYPRLFVSLVYTPQSGIWLMATPEILLRGEQEEMVTMSLAGTQKAEPSRTIADYPVEGVEWSKKNQEEQQYVTDYIEECVKGFSHEYSLNGPYTTMAANLYHLRTDIRFRLRDTQHLGDVLEKLYPTPAVCGIPKEEARQFILQHEHQPRKYYSGFVGPLSPQGKTHLFVSLRCMNILEDGSCELYAGGGLLKESEMEKEWLETEAKMQTIQQVLL